ncbi:hypothetical protein ACFFRR_009148 [Megaselia abdita]
METMKSTLLPVFKDNLKTNQKDKSLLYLLKKLNRSLKITGPEMFLIKKYYSIAMDVQRLIKNIYEGDLSEVLSLTTNIGTNVFANTHPQIILSLVATILVVRFLQEVLRSGHFKAGQDLIESLKMDEKLQAFLSSLNTSFEKYQGTEFAMTTQELCNLFYSKVLNIYNGLMFYVNSKRISEVFSTATEIGVTAFSNSNAAIMLALVASINWRDSPLRVYEVLPLVLISCLDRCPA